jgi:hypothetical protein
MPADLPPAASAVARPYYRVLSFLVGGSIALGVLLVLSYLVKTSFAQ